jgi:hypothetical protein
LRRNRRETRCGENGTRSYTRERKCRDKFLLSWLFAGDIDPRRFELQFGFAP